MYPTNEDLQVLKNVLDLAGIEQVDLQGSESQVISAQGIRNQAIFTIWTQDIKKDFQTAKFAKALVAATNRHVEAKWWIDNKTMPINRAYTRLLGKDIQEEMGR